MGEDVILDQNPGRREVVFDLDGKTVKVRFQRQ
jgi:hypothetical protein